MLKILWGFEREVLEQVVPGSSLVTGVTLTYYGVSTKNRFFGVATATYQG